MGDQTPKGWRPATWAAIIFNLAMLGLFFFAVGDFCAEYSGAELAACRNGEFGYDAGKGLIVIMWFWGNLLGGTGWVVGRIRRWRRHRR